LNGLEWLVEGHGCDADRLRDRAVLQRLFDDIVRDLDLHTVGETHWHEFPAPGGMTGLLMLQESHLACHTFPEHESICVNLFCCRPRPEWPWEEKLAALLNASQVIVRRVERAYAPSRSLP
jgi:S-adenosylmethionine decarboxylase